jgi:hypothetical protein
LTLIECEVIDNKWLHGVAKKQSFMSGRLLPPLGFPKELLLKKAKIQFAPPKVSTSRNPPSAREKDKIRSI